MAYETPAIVDKLKPGAHYVPVSSVATSKGDLAALAAAAKEGDVMFTSDGKSVRRPLKPAEGG